MSRRTIVSALFLAGLFAVGAAAQQPKFTDLAPKPKEKKTNPVDVAVAAALANDPDVLVARAKVQLAEAELAKSRQAVVLKVMTLNATIQDHKRAMASAEQRYAWAEAMMKNARMDQGTLLEEHGKLEGVRAALAKAETELKLLTGSGKEQGVELLPGNAHEAAVGAGLRYLLSAQPGEESQHATAMWLLAGLDAYRTAHAIKGPIPDRIRTALDKPVKLGPKGEKVTFEKAMEIFKKDAGLDVPVRGKFQEKSDPEKPVTYQTVELVSEGEVLPVGAWFQLFEDHAVFYGSNPPTKYQFYVRDYGILIATKGTAPPDAQTIVQFWKQQPVTPKDGR